jgi:hypothetical protein
MLRVPGTRQQRGRICQADLPKALIDPAGDGRGKVQASGVGVGAHGKVDTVRLAESLRDPVVNRPWGAIGLAAEQQVVASLEPCLPVRVA